MHLAKNVLIISMIIHNGSIDLHISCSCLGHEKVVELLLKSGANIEAQTTENKWTPFLLAAANGNFDIICC